MNDDMSTLDPRVLRLTFHLLLPETIPRAIRKWLEGFRFVRREVARLGTRKPTLGNEGARKREVVGRTEG